MERASSGELSSRRVQALLRHTGGILFEFDATGRWLDICIGDESLLVVPPDQLLGRTVIDVFGAESGAKFENFIKRAHATGEPQRLEYTLDVAAGTRAFVADALPRSADQRQTVTVLVRDVTEECKLKAQLAEAERLASVGLLAAAVGHEINNPLGFMANLIAELETQAPDPLKASVHQLKDGARRIADIVDALRMLGPPAPTTPDLPVDVRRPLEAALRLTERGIRDRARLELELCDGAYVLGSDGRLCQVFVNLLRNAADAIPEGAPHDNLVTVSVREQRGTVRIEISDTGSGIPEAAHNNLGVPFFSTRAKGPGTGLGLYVSRGIIDSLKGSLRFDACERGRGTKVTVELPSVPAPAATKAPAPRCLDSKRRYRLLAVDDERAFVVTLKHAVEPFAELSYATSATDALTALKAATEPIDFILCDLMMPGMDGAHFFEAVKEHRPELAERIIFVTGGAYTDRARAFVESCAAKVLRKPFFPEQLLELLATAANESRAVGGTA